METGDESLEGRDGLEISNLLLSNSNRGAELKDSNRVETNFHTFSTKGVKYLSS